MTADFPESGHALVVGGSGGIGAVVCEALADAGCDVLVGYRSNLAAAEAIVAAVTSRGRAAEAVQIDLTDAETVEAAARSGSGSSSTADSPRSPESPSRGQ